MQQSHAWMFDVQKRPCIPSLSPPPIKPSTSHLGPIFPFGHPSKGLNQYLAAIRSQSISAGLDRRLLQPQRLQMRECIVVRGARSGEDVAKARVTQPMNREMPGEETHKFSDRRSDK